MWAALKYELLLQTFKLALHFEAQVVHLRDWTQKQKMKCIKEVPDGYQNELERNDTR